MKVTITGARGFIGHAVATLLTERGHEVSGLSKPEWNLCQPGAWEAVADDTAVIIHTAAAFEVQAMEEVLWQTNVAALMGLVRRSRELPGLRRIIFCSSGAVYAPQGKAVEHDTPESPQTAYGMSKLLGETMLRSGCAVPVASLRLFFPFGAGQRMPRLIPRVVDAVQNGRPVKLRDSAGGPRVNPVPVSRVAAFIAGMCEESDPAGRTCNLGGPVPLTIKELALEIGHRLGREPHFTVEPADPGCLYCRPDDASGTAAEFAAALDEAVAFLK